MKFITVTDRSVTRLRIPVKNQSQAGSERVKFTEVSLFLSEAVASFGIRRYQRGGFLALGRRYSPWPWLPLVPICTNKRIESIGGWYSDWATSPWIDFWCKKRWWEQGRDLTPWNKTTEIDSSRFPRQLSFLGHQRELRMKVKLLKGMSNAPSLPKNFWQQKYTFCRQKCKHILCLYKLCCFLNPSAHLCKDPLKVWTRGVCWCDKPKQKPHSHQLKKQWQMHLCLFCVCAKKSLELNLFLQSTEYSVYLINLHNPKFAE